MLFPLMMFALVLSVDARLDDCGSRSTRWTRTRSVLWLGVGGHKTKKKETARR